MGVQDDIANAMASTLLFSINMMKRKNLRKAQNEVNTLVDQKLYKNLISNENNYSGYPEISAEMTNVLVRSSKIQLDLAFKRISKKKISKN